MIYNIIIIGSGLSALSFANSYLEEKKQINIISPDFKNEIYKNQNESLDLFHKKNLPPRMEGKKKEFKNYINLNNFNVKKNTNILGSLEFGGLSNYWGLQLEGLYEKDLKNIDKKNKIKLNKAFMEIYEKMFFGDFQNIDSHKKKNYEISSFFEKLIKKKHDSLKFLKPGLAYFNQKNQKVLNLKKFDENLRRVNPKNYYENFLKNKDIRIHNFFVVRIIKERNFIKLICYNGKVRKNFITKKLVVAAGTLSTTRLILDFLNYNKEVKIKEHPRFTSCYLSKKEIDNKINLMPSQLNIKGKLDNSDFIVDFKPGNKKFINKIFHIYGILKPFKSLFMKLKNRLVFCNFLLSSDFSNLFIKKVNDKYLIYSKEEKTKKILDKFKKIEKKIFNLLKDEKLVLNIKKKYFPGNGSSYHYFGTIPMQNKKNLSVNQYCQLNNNKNIYIVDGSVFNFKENKFPMGVIMANARRIAKKILDEKL